MKTYIIFVFLMLLIFVGFSLFFNDFNPTFWSAKEVKIFLISAGSFAVGYFVRNGKN